MQTIEVNSRKISHMLYQWLLLTVELKTGEKFIYRLLEASTFAEFINSPDRNKLYSSFKPQGIELFSRSSTVELALDIDTWYKQAG